MRPVTTTRFTSTLSSPRSVGLPGTIAHGLLEMGILADAIASWAGGSANVLSLSCRFSKPLLPGDTIICTGTVDQRRRCGSCHSGGGQRPRIAATAS